MLYDIRASFTGILGVGLNAILVITLFVKLLLVTSFMVLYWYTQLLNWGGELAVTFRYWDDIVR